MHMLIVLAAFVVIVVLSLPPDRCINLTIQGKDTPPRPKGQVNWDAERDTISTIVIHHAASVGNLTPLELSCLELERIYAPLFRAGNKDPFVVPGTPPYSGHYIKLDGELVETFAIYHSFIRLDGIRVIQLADSAIGWHAGNWKVNCHSLGICMAGNYENQSPPHSVLAGTAWQIAEWCKRYPTIKYLVGHREVRSTGPTTCPGDWFYEEGRELLFQLANIAANEKLELFFTHPNAIRSGHE